MLWFAPRSYLKWAGAVAVVGFSWWIQLMPAPTSPHPFARADIEAGTDISEQMFEFRESPAGLLPPTATQGTLTVALSAGDPLLPSLLSRRNSPVPKGWWAVELEAPPGLSPGRRVMLVAGGDEISPMGAPIPGIVVPSPLGQSHSEGTALIAVPGEHLSRVSVAASYGTLTVAIAPDR